MTPFVSRPAPRALVWLSAALVLALLSACGSPPAASTNTLAPPSATTGPTQPPEATPTASALPATETAEPPTATTEPTRAPSATRAPSVTPAATEAATATATATTAAAASPVASGDFAPTQAQVWNTAVVGADNTTGTCTATANAPYGLVLLTPGEGTLAMHNTVPEDYVLARLAPNTYQYAGASALGDGTLTLDVRFTSATTLEMTRTFISNAEPGCTHQHHYTGTFRNNR